MYRKFKGEGGGGGAGIQLTLVFPQFSPSLYMPRLVKMYRAVRAWQVRLSPVVILSERIAQYARGR